MKRKIVVATLILCLAFFILVFFKNCGFVRMGDVERAYVIYRVGNVDINKKMSDEDMKVISKMFSGRLMATDTPACGFSENVSIVFDGSKTFCIAQDTCPTILYKEKDKYFSISVGEQEKLYAILERYGFSFPNV
ncbi:MAG: hypothetical protein IKL44_00880 [Clostridia bacterium]|nr:hypothetical protein [Clostridia bacterium]